MSKCIFDASAVLALLHNEQGGAVVSDLLNEHCVMSAVNLAEVVSKQMDINVPVNTTLSLVRMLGIHIDEFDSESAAIVGSLRHVTSKYGLSLGDRACLALGLKLRGTVVTADRTWSQLDIGVEIVQIR